MNRDRCIVYVLIIVAVCGLVPAAAGAGFHDGRKTGKKMFSEPQAGGTEMSSVSVPWERLAAGAAFVGACGLVALYLWKRRPRAGGNRMAEVLESRPVSGDMSIHLVRVGERVFIVASTGEAVRKIGEVQRDMLPERGQAEEPAGKNHFRTVLRSVLGGGER